MDTLNFSSWLIHAEADYQEGLGTGLMAAGSGLMTGIKWIDKLVTTLPAIAKDILGAYRGTTPDEVISNKQVLAAIKSLSKLNQKQVEQEANAIIAQKGNEANIILAWEKQNINLQKAIQAIVYLGDLLHIAPFFRSAPVKWEEFSQATKTINTATTTSQKALAIVTASWGLMKLLHFVVAGGNVTGIWAKLAMLGGQYELGGYLLGMCYIGWGMIFILKLAQGHTPTTILRAAIAALLKLINPVNETTLPDLHQSAVDAFPGTRKRQHIVAEVNVSELRYTPFLGVKTLFVKSIARNEDRSYRPMMLFKDVEYLQEGGVTIVGNDDRRIYRLHPVTENDTLLRCDCKDFSFRFNYYNSLDKSLYGRVRKKYENQGGLPANPREMPGMCKHLMALVLVLREAGLLSDMR